MINGTRKEKVEQIKQEIQEGTTIDRNRIAEKLVENNKTWNTWETKQTITSIPETRTTEITPSTENQQHDGTTNVEKQEITIDPEITPSQEQQNKQEIEITNIEQAGYTSGQPETITNVKQEKTTINTEKTEITTPIRNRITSISQDHVTKKKQARIDEFLSPKSNTKITKKKNNINNSPLATSKITNNSPKIKRLGRKKEEKRKKEDPKTVKQLQEFWKKFAKEQASKNSESSSTVSATGASSTDSQTRSNLSSNNPSSTASPIMIEKVELIRTGQISAKKSRLIELLPGLKSESSERESKKKD